MTLVGVGVYLSSNSMAEVKKTQHQNPEFGPKPGEIFQKTCIQVD
jgi:hypothetical protein